MWDDHGKLHPLPLDIKERLHELPAGFTNVEGLDSRDRHRVLGNGWHAGVVRFLFGIMMLTIVASPASAQVIPSQVRTTTLQWVISVVLQMPAHVGPGGWTLRPQCIPPAVDMWDHWSLAADSPHPLQHPPRVAPGFLQCLQLQQTRAADLDRIRREVVQDVCLLVEDAQDSTLEWWSQLPPHLQQVYYDAEHKQITQVPVLLQLLDALAFPGLSDLAEDLHKGFSLTGRLHSGSGWLPRTDDRYSFPIPLEVFAKHNHHYVLQKLRSHHVDRHWQVLLDELGDELENAWRDLMKHRVHGVAQQSLLVECHFRRFLMLSQSLPCALALYRVTRFAVAFADLA